MKVMVVSLAFGVASLGIGSSSAQSLHTFAAPDPATVSSQTADYPSSEPQDLPDAPQASPGNAASPGFTPGMGQRPLSSQTFHDKFMTYAVITVGPRALFSPALPAAIRMAKPLSHYPPEWRQGAQAFGRNYGDQLATVSALQTGRFAVGATLHEDLRYHPSTSANFFLRTGHALAFTCVDQSDDGHARLALANFAGLAAGSYVGMSYLPSGFNDVTHVDQRLAVQFGRLAGSNIAQEFAPDLIRFARKHHLPNPRIPIPDWWTKR